MNGEEWLLERLKQQGIDVYARATFDSLRDRLAHILREERYGPVIAGLHNGKPETYAELFERTYGVKLKDVPRATVSNTKQSTGT